MDKELELENLAIDVFEKMGFLLGNKGEKKDFIYPSFSDYIKATIEFKGEKKGSVEIITTKTIGKILTANILGIDSPDDVKDDYQADAIMEFLNVFCGNLVTALYGTGLIFNMGIPVISSPDKGEIMSTMSETASGFLIVEENPFIFMLREN